MPELPEVETVCRGLAPVMEGETIAKARVNRPDLRKPFPKGMARRLTGRRVHRLWRRSKYLLADLDRDETLLVHLGMSGRMTVSGDPLGRFVRDHPPASRHDHVVLIMGSGARIVFNDPRRFGLMDLVPTAQTEESGFAGERSPSPGDSGDSGVLCPLLAGLGPEPLGNGFHEDYLVAALRGRSAPIKAALLDQRVVAGLGNIYVCEALFRAGISPSRKAGRIGASRVSRLSAAIRDVLREAIEAGGSSLKDFRQADGELGYFQHRFEVYDREGESCARANEGCLGKVRRIVQSGRSSFYCPSCQR